MTGPARPYGPGRRLVTVEAYAAALTQWEAAYGRSATEQERRLIRMALDGSLVEALRPVFARVGEALSGLAATVAGSLAADRSVIRYGDAPSEARRSIEGPLDPHP